MPSPVCVPCRQEMKLRHWSMFVEIRGQVWHGGEYCCKDCGTSVIVNFGEEATGIKAALIEEKRPGMLVKAN